jgi:lipoprotein-anchoring transpeptidase ErfK/SrfK
MLYESRVPKAVPKPAEPNPKISVPAKGYCVLVDISDQKVYVYNNDALIRSMTCSSGAGASTPLGTYKIGSRGTWFYSSKYKQGGKYWVGFIGGKFLFHSVPFDKNKNMIRSEAEKLGTPASHGCIRLSIDDSHWFYDTVPRGARVIIRK